MFYYGSDVQYKCDILSSGDNMINKLWQKNFTILTLGSFISALGNSAASVAFGIMIYQRTGSPLTLAIFVVANIIPRLLTAFIAGPFVDRHSRVKIVYGLDFFSALIFILISFTLYSGYFDVLVFTLIGSLFGIIDTIYQLAFMSLFPETISEGNHSRAYSLSSLIWPLSAAVMAPVATFMIENIQDGIALLMLFNGITYFIAALFETRIKVTEHLNQNEVVGFKFIHDIKEGFQYYKVEKGILGIGLLFACFSFVYASHDLLRMPYFASSDIYDLTHFSLLISASSIGRIIGGFIHYIFKYPPKKRYIIAVSVYITVEVLSATLLYTPLFVMITISFIVGLLSVTSFNIRMSATQIYIPKHMRGRVNASQNLLWQIGAIVGALSAGLVAEYSNLDFRFIMLLAAVISLSAILVFPIRMHKAFKHIYNADV